jgi:hypothetical protein
MVTRASAVTISRAAEFLSKDQRTIAFALAEMEYLWELLAEHKRNIPAVLSGWLRLTRSHRAFKLRSKILQACHPSGDARASTPPVAE